jgi:apolipoprotein N-acyltransferase
MRAERVGPEARHMEKFTHVRIVMGMIVSLGLTHMLKGLSSTIQHPTRTNVYAIHLAWVASLILNILQFWWWEFSLREIPVWTFGIYLYLILYAFIIYLMCAMLFPDSIREYQDYREYFLSRRRWFFGLLLTECVIDIGDSLIKGEIHVASLGDVYWIRTAFVAIGCLFAIRTRNQVYHASFVSMNLVTQVLLVANMSWASA